MHIDSYQFGRITVDGVSYSADIIILGDTVRPNWWRKQGHLLMKVPQDTRRALQQSNIQLEALDTRKAVQRFNELSQAGTNVAAALHLTC
jgi:hypothetical protein